MEIKYEWVIAQLECKPTENNLNDVVYRVHWIRNGYYIENNITYIGTVGQTFLCSTPSGDDFTPYENLTKDQIIGWLENGLDLISIEIEINRQINVQINPPIIVLPLPWNE